jgi:type III pantothenate kinase
VLRIVADVGNTRLKWGYVAETGQVKRSVALPADDPSAWDEAWKAGPSGPSIWAVASVNPPASVRVQEFLNRCGASETRWYRSAADVPVRHQLTRPESTGADRALAVAAAVSAAPTGRPGQVVLCGTAITVERVSAAGIWQGGAIAPGLALSARALHNLTAQLPEIAPKTAPSAWGDTTGPALEAGIYWGVVGAIRELLSQQAADLGPNPWLVWSGGDAERLAAQVSRSDSQVIPDLVLAGLAQVAFGVGAGRRA